jgi:hypothetical protein
VNTTPKPRATAATTTTSQNTATVEYEYAERVRRVVDDFPPLTPEQKDQIAALLRPVSRSDRQPTNPHAAESTAA